MCGDCGSGRTLPYVPSDELGALYPGSYNAYALPEAPLARAAATGLFRWRYWKALRRLPLRALAADGSGRLLDVGSGRGDLGRGARRARLAGDGSRALRPTPARRPRSRGVPKRVRNARHLWPVGR